MKFIHWFERNTTYVSVRHCKRQTHKFKYEIEDDDKKLIVESEHAEEKEN